MAEKRSAFMPSHIAWPSVPRPRKTGQLEDLGYFSEMRGSGFSSVTISPVGLAYGDAIAVRRAHHDAFHHGLAADQGRFLAAFEDGQQLDMREKTQETAQVQ